MPIRVAEAYYRVRFGGDELADAEHLELKESVDRLSGGIWRMPLSLPIQVVVSRKGDSSLS